jgi:hypothetical protein
MIKAELIIGKHMHRLKLHFPNATTQIISLLTFNKILTVVNPKLQYYSTQKLFIFLSIIYII